MGRPDRCLVLIPRALQPNADRVNDAVYTFVGACQGDRSDQGEWERPAAPTKVLLVSLGSSFTKQPAFYRACVEAFGDLPGWHVVLQIGRFVDPAELGEVPANVEVRTWVPQLAVLRQADVFITHAGAGGSQEGLATATPMVAVPQAVDQFGNADMLVSLGVARRVDDRGRHARGAARGGPRAGGRSRSGPQAGPDRPGDGVGGRYAQGGGPDRGRAPLARVRRTGRLAGIRPGVLPETSPTGEDFEVFASIGFRSARPHEAARGGPGKPAAVALSPTGRDGRLPRAGPP